MLQFYTLTKNAKLKEIYSIGGPSAIAAVGTK